MVVSSHGAVEEDEDIRFSQLKLMVPLLDVVEVFDLTANQSEIVHNDTGAGLIQQGAMPGYPLFEGVEFETLDEIF